MLEQRPPLRPVGLPQKTTGRRKRRVLVILALGALLAAASLGWFGWLSGPVGWVTARISGPLHTAGAAVSNGAARLRFFASSDECTLRDELDKLRAENAKLAALAEENDSLKAAVGYKDRAPASLVAARVIAESGADTLRTMAIDRGSDDGLAVGDPVVTGDGLLVGKVHDVEAKTATVLRLEDSRSRLAVTVQNLQETIGILEGQRGLSAVITLIPQAEVISPGDSVVTSGIEPGVPRGLIVGTVEKVEKRNQDPFQTALIRPFPEAVHPIMVAVLRAGPNN